MSELSRDEILSRVRENKEALETARQERDAAVAMAEQAQSEINALRAELDEKTLMLGEAAQKDQAIEELLMQVQEQQDKALALESELQSTQAALAEQTQLAQELSDLLK